MSSPKSEVLTFQFKHKQKINTQCAYYMNSQNLLHKNSYIKDKAKKAPNIVILNTTGNEMRKK